MIFFCVEGQTPQQVPPHVEHQWWRDQGPWVVLEALSAEAAKQMADKLFTPVLSEGQKPHELSQQPQLLNLLCPECKQPQIATPSGASCVNGHGGLEGIEA